MTISLSDISTAVADYVDTQVITTVSPVSSKDTTQDVLTPGDTGTFTVTATNGDATRGVRVLNVLYHLKVKDAKVLGIVPPHGILVGSFQDAKKTKPITSDDPVGEVFVENFVQTTLDAGEAGTPLHLTVQCLDQGTTTITARVHADVDQDDVFLTSQSKNATQDVEVI